MRASSSRPTEIRKVPCDGASRCQRFDLRRVDASLLVSHLSGTARPRCRGGGRGAGCDRARAAEGSVRDSLSILDQAIAHARRHDHAGDVRSMLGLADRARVIDLFEAVMKGDIATALGELRAPIRCRRRPGGGAVRPRRISPIW